MISKLYNLQISFCQQCTNYKKNVKMSKLGIVENSGEWKRKEKLIKIMTAVLKVEKYV